MIMHCVFLGAAESNFELLTIWNKIHKVDRKCKANAHELISYLQKFQLSWLLTCPFGTSDKGGCTTGGWVSENWLGFTRVSKIVYYWCAKDGISSRRIGSDDILRMVIAFTAMVARIMSHSGATRQEVSNEVSGYIKEFLSCLREVDILIRHEQMKKKPPKRPPSSAEPQPGTELPESERAPAASVQTASEQPQPPAKKKKSQKKAKNKTPGGDEDDGGTGAWWTKSNYVSLLNIPEAILAFGPLVNWWDGGGKGEKFVQLIKPLITRGVRDRDTFFVRILERVYKLRVLSHFNAVYSLFEADPNDTDTRAEYYLADDGTLQPVDELENEAFDHPDEVVFDPETAEYSHVEDKQMSKTRTIYVYKSKEILDSALADHKPIAGIVVHRQDADRNNEEEDINDKMELYATYRIRRKKGQLQSPYGWCRIAFDDSRGESHGGLWYAPFKKEDVRALPPMSEDGLAKIAKMSAVAIPFSYAIGDSTLENSFNYCVITNWWKERTQEGKYMLPGLAPSLYNSPDNNRLIRERLKDHSDDGGPLPHNAI
jgi:hypothetical protein